MSEAERLDPSGVIAAGLKGELAHPARDVFLAWVMALPPEVDAAGAAAVLLRAYRPDPSPLAALLEEAAAAPSTVPRRRRRR
ncbi:MAG: hypothetical protein KDG89_08900 [Geminicoccaceae bacterium]|nr:hypothetical protein [Geminicoccaceae bacterium]